MEVIVHLHRPRHGFGLRGSEGVQWGQMLGHVGNEASVIIYHTEESLHADLRVWGRVLQEIRDPRRKGFDPCRSDEMSKIFDLRFSESTLLGVNADPIGLKKLEEFLKVAEV